MMHRGAVGGDPVALRLRFDRAIPAEKITETGVVVQTVSAVEKCHLLRYDSAAKMPAGMNQVNLGLSCPII